jgi:hypothetical protein
MVVFIAFTLLLCSCTKTDDVKETSSEGTSGSIETTVAPSDDPTLQSDAVNGVLWDKRDFFDFSKAVFESINEVLYKDYLTTKEGKIGSRNTYFYTTDDGLYDLPNRKIPLSKEQILQLEEIISHSGYVFDNIKVSEGRISYIFGLGLRQYIYTLDGKPPAYYFKEGDRNPLYPREEDFGENWYYVKTGG